MSAVEITQNNKCKKYVLPDGRFLDVLTEVFDEIFQWLQLDNESSESGGYIVGYQHEDTQNVSLEKASHPYSGDYRTRVHFTIKDHRHKLFLMKAKMKKSYYMGVWHTHPQDNPEPSSTDWEDWKSSVNNELSGCGYILFIIAGRRHVRIWAGNTETKEIVEIEECKRIDDVYIV